MPLLYLDTSDLINLSRLRDEVSRARLSELVSAKRVQVVLSFSHILEAWKYVDKSANLALAEYADSLSPLWILERDYLFREELRIAFLAAREVPHSAHALIPLRRSPLEVFGKGRATQQCGFQELLQLLDADDDFRKRIQIMAELHDQYRAWTDWTRENVSRDLPGRDVWFQSLARSSLRDLRLRDQDICGFVASLTPKTCPSVFLYLSVRDAINRDKALIPHPSEMVDLVHLVALPYVDTFSTDKRIADFVRRVTFKSSLGSRRKPSASVFKSLSSALDYLEHA